jgi:hypothetical protein
MFGIHDVFPANEKDENDPISLKKLKQLEGQWALEKEILGFDFDGVDKSMILATQKRDFILNTLRLGIRQANKGIAGIPFAEFESLVCKLRHSFIALPAGKGLLTGCNRLMCKRPPIVFLQRNKELKQCLDDSRRLLRESTAAPTPCKELVIGNPIMWELRMLLFMESEVLLWAMRRHACLQCFGLNGHKILRMRF